MMDVTLDSSEILTTLVRSTSINSWENLISHVQLLPYGRNSSRSDLSLVIIEGKGTCSSKHAFLAKVAAENHLEEVQLFIGIYKMNAINTPGIGASLQQHKLDYIPEAHCYLKIEGVSKDFTSAASNFSNIEQELMEEIEITSSQVVNFKIAYHQKFLRKWLVDQDIHLNFEELWSIREQCIENLTTLKI